MEIQIVYVFHEKNFPRYAFGRIGENNYVVISPVNEGDNSFEFKTSDIVKIKTISLGPVEATNKTSQHEISIGLCDIGITSEEIRKKYCPMFE